MGEKEPDDTRGGNANPDPSTLRHAKQAHEDHGHPSWNDLLTKVEDRVRRWFAPGQIPRPHGVEDLILEVQERVLRGLPRIELRDRDSFWAWVHVVAQRALSDLARRRPPSAVRLDASSAPEVADGKGATASLHARHNELVTALRDCLAGMREETATVLRLRLLEHQSYDEICPQVGRQRAVTVRSIFHRGMEKLVACMRAKGFDAWGGP